MSKNIIITGATGLIGTHIFNKLLSGGYKVSVVTRTIEGARAKLAGAEDYILWEDKTGLQKAINNAKAVIHLAGAPVLGARWTARYKEEILKSRQDATRSLVEIIGSSEKKPEALISASAIGYYGSDPAGEYDEGSPAGNDFLSKVCIAWEQEAQKSEASGLRRVSVRIGIVLVRNEGALARMLTPYKFFIGGPIGNGKQGFPWIHIDDLSDIFIRAVEDMSFTGAVNAVAPERISMNDFARTLGKVLGRPSWLKVPSFVLKIILGQGASAVLDTPYVIPKKLKERGYKFKYTHAAEALRDILS